MTPGLMRLNKQTTNFTMKRIFKLTLAAAVFTAILQTATAQDLKSDSLAIIETALNYGDGFYSGSAERMEKAISPDLFKVAPLKLPNSDQVVLTQSTFSGLVEMSRAKVGFVPEEARKIEVKVLKIAGDLAFARLTSAQFNDYLAMARVDGQWKIINVLWTHGPDSRNRSMVPVLDASAQKPLVEQTVRDYFEGFLSSDPERVSKALHFRFSQATLITLPPTNKIMINRDGYDQIMGYAKAKIGAQDPSKLNLKVEMVDYMDGIAIAQLTIGPALNLIQVVNINGEWKITSILRKR
jgi:hypothetical protein